MDDDSASEIYEVEKIVGLRKKVCSQTIVTVCHPQRIYTLSGLRFSLCFVGQSTAILCQMEGVQL